MCPAESVVNVIGGEGPRLLFAHANGFPPETYQSFLAPFMKHYEVAVLHLPPLWLNGPKHDALKDWKDFVSWLTPVIKSQPKVQVMMGHSLGAVVSMLLNAYHPHLCEQLVLIDPVFYPKQRARLMSWVPNAVKQRHPFIRKTLMRPEHFSSLDSAFEFHRSKRAYAGMSDDVLWDYIRAAFKPEGDRVNLIYSKFWEAKVYGTVRPFWRELLKCENRQLIGVRGERSDVLTREACEYWREIRPHDTLLELPDTGHLLPLESPLPVAEAIIKQLQD